MTTLIPRKFRYARTLLKKYTIITFTESLVPLVSYCILMSKLRQQSLNEISILVSVPNKNLTLFNDLWIFNKVFMNQDGDVVLCIQPEYNVLKCTRNMDFNMEYSQNDKVGSIQ